MIGLIDSTLREGEQMMGVYFTLNQKLDIIRHLVAIGVEEIEVGIAAMSADIPALLAPARAGAPNTRFALWCRGCVSDIRESAVLMPDVLAISLPVSDLHITARLRKDRAWLLRQVAIVTAEARTCGVPFVSLGLEDATRADTAFVAAVVQQAQSVKVDRIRLSDTLGVATPAALVRLIRTARKGFTGQIGVHTHNDFGMATANALAALEAGADWADVTLLGIGERAGNARLEEVIGYLTLNKGQLKYNASALYSACHAVARMTGMLITPHHPIIGKRIFACETGLHLDGLAKDPATYEPFPPERVRAIRKYALGKKVGRHAVLMYLQTMGYTVSSAEVETLTQRIRVLAQRLSRPLSQEEIMQLVANLQADHV